VQLRDVYTFELNEDRNAQTRLGRVLINPGTPFDVRYAPDSGAKADIAGLPRCARSGNQRGRRCDKGHLVFSHGLPYVRIHKGGEPLC
jgi:hypothetical protein